MVGDFDPREPPCRRVRIRVSFEFFPPKTEEMERTLWESIERLAPLRPNFVSVTYGAGGSTRERTHATVKRILAETALTPAAHLTCVSATRDEVDGVIRAYRDAGVRHIVALRGDPAGGVGEKYAPHPGGYRNARRSRRRHQAHHRCGGLGLGLSGEASGLAPRSKPTSTCWRPRSMPARRARSPSSSSRTISISAISSACGRAASPCRSRPASCRCRTSSRRRAFAAARRRLGAGLARGALRGLDDDPATRKLIAAAIAAEQVLDLVDRGVTDFHFYTMNRADLVYAICHLLGLRPADEGGCVMSVEKTLRERRRPSASSCSTARWAR